MSTKGPVALKRRTRKKTMPKRKTQNQLRSTKMSYRCACSHLAAITDIPISNFLGLKKRPSCDDCGNLGPDLWICLQRDCLKIGCSQLVKDHGTIHNLAHPSHCIQMNLSTYRVWCNECKSEVFMENLPQQGSVFCNDSDQDTEDGPVISRDSGHGSYSTLRTNTPDRTTIFAFDRTVGLNVSMNGDSSESSDGEESSPCDKPSGLVGLQNIGNTCYMNAALQALSNTVPLTNFFLECPAAVHVISEGRKPGLSRTYQALMKDIWLKKAGGYVTPSGILYGIRNVHSMFRGYHQHDTQEFLRNFMDQLHEELKQVAPPEPSGNDGDTFSLAMDDPPVSYDSSEGEYETCDSGVSERSSLSDDTERPTNTAKRRLSRSGSPGRKIRSRIQSTSVIESQPSTSNQNISQTKKQVKYRSIISDIFDGKLLSSVQCLTCDRVSSRVETFQDLSLPIPSRDHLVMLHGRNNVPGVTCTEAVLPSQDGWISWIFSWLRSWFYGPTVTLHDCLAAFFSTDELKGDNMYSCERCNKLRNGIKFSKVLQLPEVLCIHLKRFRHELMFSSKISAAVSFPLKGLDMRLYLHSECTSHVTSYDLSSVICHYGTAGGGHYTCYAQNQGLWYEFDDQCVTRVSPEAVQSCEAYVLFYRKSQTGMNEVKNKVKGLLKTNPLSEDIVYVSKQWLCRFNTCAEPGPIDNSDFLCQHGALNPERALCVEQLTVVMPRAIYDYLYKKYGGSPPVNALHICPACQALQRRLLLEMETFVQLSRDYEMQENNPTHILSLAWYSQWQNFVQKRTQEPPGPIDNSKLNLDNNHEYAEINEEIWNFFYNIYGGGPELKIKPKSANENDMREDMEEDQDTMLAFFIPTLRRSEERGGINKTMYCHGEPMETEPIKENGLDHEFENNGSHDDEQAMDDSSQMDVQHTYKMNGPKMDGRKIDGHRMDGHKYDGHRIDGHRMDGNRTDGHRMDGNRTDGHRMDGHKMDGHKDGHKMDGHKMDGHKMDGHKIDGHKSDSYRLDGHKTDGYRLEGHKSDSHRIDGHKYDSHGHKMDGHRMDIQHNTEHQGKMDYQQNCNQSLSSASNTSMTDDDNMKGDVVPVLENKGGRRHRRRRRDAIN